MRGDALPSSSKYFQEFLGSLCSEVIKSMMLQSLQSDSDTFHLIAK